ncbi:MAG TPA: hypothetical protein VIV06_01265 [Candidatus Limnocylindrales bacterium]
MAVSRQSGWISPVVVAGGVVSGTWEVDAERVTVAWFGEAGAPLGREPPDGGGFGGGFGGNFGGGFGGGVGGGVGGSLGNPFRRGIDEETLKQVAELTGAEYYSAETAGELQKVFEALPTPLIVKQEVVEIGVAFVAIGALLAALALLLGQAWRALP